MRQASLGLVGFGFGLLLAYGGLVTAGVGHGSYVPLDLAAAPVSIIPIVNFIAPPFFWGLIGFLAGCRRYRALLGLLTLHTVSALAIVVFLDTWERVVRALSASPSARWTVLLWAAGLGVAWAWTLFTRARTES